MTATTLPQQTTVKHGQDEFAITLVEQASEYDTPYLLTYLHGPRKGRKFKLHQSPDTPELVYSGIRGEGGLPEYLFSVDAAGHLEEVLP